MTDAVVAGAGLAGLTCAYLLAGQDRRVLVTGWEPGRAAPPARWLVLNELTTALLREIWDGGDDLFDGAWPIRRRHVHWGDSRTDQPLEQPALAVDGTQLAQRLGVRLTEVHPDLVRFTAADTVPPVTGWLVAAGHPTTGQTGVAGQAGVAGAAGARPIDIGRRTMISAQVRLAAAESITGSHLVTTGPAWIFLAPVGPGRALVQAMVPGPVADPVPLLRRLLADTELGHRLAAAPTAAVVVPAAPRLRRPLCGPGWFSVGDGAVRFDPLCGSGSTQAIRTAVLTAAAIDAIDRGVDEHDVRAHVTDRVLTAFAEHVRTCLGLYMSALASDDPGGTGTARVDRRVGLDPLAWRDEIDLMAAGLRRFGPATGSSSRFTLTGPLPGWRLVPHVQRNAPMPNGPHWAAPSASASPPRW
ncbi:hypothetical protein MXD59_25275 [Frankia sp. Ag45/Mut15]|uniref:Uncharacterized protein n=1 Tax=Frankia umida TaxID=573489 RepID=A0ABT0K5E3_9ACTN|nr:hypothetical protein [Frankia umida]MCK9879029.1 hypothetical protein [Frankia umida]